MSEWVGSPNFTSGRQGSSIRHIVVHHMVGTLASTDSVFQNASRNTSAHYGVGQGVVHQYVSETDTAYHAGNWQENLQSIGIEHEDFGRDEFTDELYRTSADLIRDICSRHGLPINRETIHPHNEFTATACPGALDIDRLISEANNQSNQGNNEVAALDLARARVLSWGILGRNGYDGHSNALNGDADGDLNANHVGKDPYNEIWDFFQSPEGKEWIEVRLPAIYKRVSDLSVQNQSQQTLIDVLNDHIRILTQTPQSTAVVVAPQPTTPVQPPEASTPSNNPVNASDDSKAEPVKEGLKTSTRTAALAAISFGVSYLLENVVPGLPKNEIGTGLTLVLTFVDKYIHENQDVKAKGLLPF